jgi:hypothetical protein
MGGMPQLLGEPAPRLLDISGLIDRHHFSVGIRRIENRNPDSAIPPNPLSTDLSTVLAPAPRLRGLKRARRGERSDPEIVERRRIPDWRVVIARSGAMRRSRG